MFSQGQAAGAAHFLAENSLRYVPWRPGSMYINSQVIALTSPLLHPHHLLWAGPSQGHLTMAWQYTDQSEGHQL